MEKTNIELKNGGTQEMLGLELEEILTDKNTNITIASSIISCVEQIQKEFNLPTDNTSTIQLAGIIHQWYKEEQTSVIEVFRQVYDRNLTVWVSKE